MTHQQATDVDVLFLTLIYKKTTSRSRQTKLRRGRFLSLFFRRALKRVKTTLRRVF